MKFATVIKFWLAILFVGLLPQTPGIAASQLSVIPRQEEGNIRSGFIFTVNPGEGKEDFVAITNNSGRDFTIQVSSKDASYAANGGLQISQGSQDLGAWITFEQSEINIAAGQSSEVKFTIAVPATASIGEHNAAIVAVEKSTAGSDNLISASTSIRVTVPGKVQRKISWGKISHSFEKGKLVFSVNAKNESNINLQPSLDIQYLGLLGKANQAELAPTSVAPGGNIQIKTTWQHLTPILGLYRYKLTLHTLSSVETLPDGKVNNLADETITTTYSFTTGGKLLTGIIAGLLLLWLLGRYRVFAQDKRKYTTRITHHRVKPGESLIHIASTTGIQSKQLIRFNKLSWPYTLAVGETLLIPGGRLHREELQDKHPDDRLPSFIKYIFSTRPSLYQPKVRPAESTVKTQPSQKKVTKKITKLTNTKSKRR